MNKRGVFSSKVSVTRSLPRYVILAVVLGFCSYLLIDFLVEMGGAVALAKPLAEGLLFVASFSIQRHFVFSTRAT
jgi:putative flippase GtrA